MKRWVNCATERPARVRERWWRPQNTWVRHASDTWERSTRPSRVRLLGGELGALGGIENKVWGSKGW